MSTQVTFVTESKIFARFQKNVSLYFSDNDIILLVGIKKVTLLQLFVSRRFPFFRIQRSQISAQPPATPTIQSTSVDRVLRNSTVCICQWEWKFKRNRPCVRFLFCLRKGTAAFAAQGEQTHDTVIYLFFNRHLIVWCIELIRDTVRFCDKSSSDVHWHCLL